MHAPEVERPGLPLVAFRVYAACLGWGMLTGAVMGALYLALSLMLDGRWDGSGGVAMLVGAAYGAPLGLVTGAVLGVGAALGAVAGAVLAEKSSAVPAGAVASAAAPARTSRTVWLSRGAFLLTAVVALLLWRYVFGGESDNWAEWRLVLVVALALVFGTWRAGRATRRALTPPRRPPGAGRKRPPGEPEPATRP